MATPKKRENKDGGRTVGARLTAADMRRFNAYAARLAASAKVRVGPSIVAAALIREGLDAVERAEAAS